MVFSNRTFTLLICFPALLFQGLPIQGWGFSDFRNWARRNPIKTQLAAGSIAVSALAAIQSKALAYVPASLKEKMKEYPGRTALCAALCTGLIGWGLAKALNAFCAPEEHTPQPDLAQSTIQSNTFTWHLYSQRQPHEKYPYRFGYGLEYTGPEGPMMLRNANPDNLMDDVEELFPNYSFSREEVLEDFHDERNRIMDADRSSSENDIGGFSDSDSDIPSRI